MDRGKIALARLYRRLFSRFWPERLKAYDMIAEDLEHRGCRLFKIKQLMPHEIDAKLLTGQIVSIYMKRLERPLRLDKFTTELEKLYDFLLQPLGHEMSRGHRLVKKLLLSIYDDDDRAARQQIEAFFQKKPRAELSVLENMFRCYGAAMWEVRERYRAVRVRSTDVAEEDEEAHAAEGHGVA